MSKIKVLDKAITNRISAGEVVEKPASIVKELLENSIDAGADRITIEIENGGLSRIAITDNGCGMEQDDLVLAITPHATSKISVLEDLNTIQTLGFRGEALSSIASVSIMEIISKTEAQEVGSKLSSRGGEITQQSQTACPVGTYVEVASLFFNTPVRAKFLRKPKTEESDITDYVERIMLAFPSLSFKYIIDGKIKYNTTGGGLLDNIYTIYGQEVADGVVEVDWKNASYHIKGYLGKPEISKPNRNYQSLFVSDRYVKNYMISSAIQNAYEHYLMKNKFPFYVLNLILPYDNVDVNVHPNKLEVKFEKPNEVFSAFFACANHALSNMDQTKNISLTEKAITPAVASEKVEELPENVGASYQDKAKNETVQENLFSDYQTNLNNQNLQNTKFTFSKSSYIDTLKKPVEVFVVPAKEPKQKANETEHVTIKKDSIADVLNYKVVGTLFNTYNIIESGEHVYFIDQHAAHERILYDKYMAELKSQTVTGQDLLVPYVINVKDIETDFLSQYLPLLSEIGFVISLFGHNTFKVTSVPYIFSSINLQNFFTDVLSDYNEYAKKPMDYIKIKIATKACKAAVKAGHVLSENEIRLIFETMKNGVLLCPHGRPFVMKLEKLQVEKWFKRVL